MREFLGIKLEAMFLSKYQLKKLNRKERQEYLSTKKRYIRFQEALEGQNTKASIMQSLLHTGERLGRLMGVTEKALDPNSPSGSNISKDEKDKIYKALKEVEEKIASLKKAIE